MDGLEGPQTLRLLGSAGSNRAMEAELKRLAVRGLSQPPGKPERLTEQSLRYPFRADLAWLAVRYARTPSRILWDILDVQAERLEPLYERCLHGLASRLAWLEPNLSFSVDVRRSDDFAAGPLQIRGVVKNALVAAAEGLRCPLRLDAQNPDLLFRVEAGESRVVVSIDLAGRSLHRRGARVHVAEASLKETLAAQLLLLARWNPRREALIDPMAGAGTLLLEAAAMAQGASIWPSAERPPVHRLRPFRELEQDAPDLFPGPLPPLVGVEVHTPAHRAFTTNVSRARLGSAIRILHGDFRDMPPDQLTPKVDPSEPGLVVANPPYGERLAEGRGRERELQGLYEDLRDWWRSLGPGWRLALLGPGPALRAVFGDRPRLNKPMRNGALRVALLVYESSL